MQSPLYSPEALRTSIRSLRIIDARSSESAYSAGHLEGAVYADLGKTLSAAHAPGADPAHGGRHPLPPAEAFAAQLGAWGIAPDTTVLLYDDQSGANAAARGWWMLRSLGHRKAYVLDGGLAAAIEAGVPTSQDVPAVPPLPAYPHRGWQFPTVKIEEVAERASSPAWKVLDVRSGERYRGESETLDPSAGHIPGAVNLPYASNLDARGRFRSSAELRAQYTELLAGVPPEHLIIHCGSGVTACHTLLALEIAELPGSALYVGSWSEWCRSGREQGKGP
jgi:thiosulfate/3-mercaptopyruvate sulfurtransferase